MKNEGVIHEVQRCREGRTKRNSIGQDNVDARGGSTYCAVHSLYALGTVFQRENLDWVQGPERFVPMRITDVQALLISRWLHLWWWSLRNCGTRSREWCRKPTGVNQEKVRREEMKAEGRGNLFKDFSCRRKRNGVLARRNMEVKGRSFLFVLFCFVLLGDESIYDYRLECIRRNS